MMTKAAGLGHIPVRDGGEDQPLLWLLQHKSRNGAPHIDVHHAEAGERLGRDLLRAQIVQSTTMGWSPVGRTDGGGHGLNPTEAMVQSRQRATRALEAVGPEFSGLLIDLCGYGKGLSRIEQDRQWPPRSAKIIVRFALSALARHYGLEPVARGRQQVRSVSWMEQGARPCFPNV
jgi:hypothetical protein